MNKLLLFIIVGMLAYWGWENQVKVVVWGKSIEGNIQGTFARRAESPDDAPAMEAEAGAKPAAAPAGTMVSPAAPTKPAPKVVELAEGTYFTRERLTEMTEKGVRSIGAGVQVKRVGGTSGKVSIQNDTTTLNTDPWKLTRDPEEIKKLTGIIVVLPASATADNATQLPTNEKKADVPQGPISSLNAELKTMDKQMDRIQSQLRRVDTQ